MTNYYLTSSYGKKLNASSKARNDIDDILSKRGFKPIIINSNTDTKSSKLNKVLFHKEYIKSMFKIIKTVKKNDFIFYQHPIQGATEFNILAELLKNKEVKLVAIVHDLEIFRKWDLNYNGRKAILNDVKILSKCEYVILHNQLMLNKFHEVTQIEKNKLINLEIFDYLFLKKTDKKTDISECVTIAGNLRKEKAGYIYDLKLVENDFTLFGVGYNTELTIPNITYKGAIPPDEIVDRLEGKYGLVWDGDSIETCSGNIGEYLKVNNPHKTSLYLAAGLPVIIWEEAALSSFIVTNNCGIVVNSLKEIPQRIKQIDKEMYKEMKDNCIKLSTKLSKGYFTNKALDEVFLKEDRRE